MASASGRFILAFNGEIYNFAALRERLLAPPCGYPFKGRSDTEVMLAAFERWGVVKALQMFTGMFAFALWDRHDRLLYLGRDRLGEKPLYYGYCGNAFIFASELKALTTYPGFSREIDREALARYMHYGYVPAPYSIYEHVRKLPPGVVLTLAEGKRPALQTYWSAAATIEHALANPLDASEPEILALLGEKLLQAVSARMIADVPLGAFLSGGIDSSTVVALMQAQSARPVKTFSIGFHEATYNEAEQAAKVAKYLGSDHTELYLTPREAMAVIPRLPTLYDEPFADASQIPTFLVSELARREVTVSLSGDGGDELFGGYNRYILGPELWNKIRWCPPHVRRGLAHILKMARPDQWKRLESFLGPFLKRYGNGHSFGEKIHKLGDILGVADSSELYHNLTSQRISPQVLLPNSAPLPANTGRPPLPSLGALASEMMYLDLTGYLPDDILTKVDRASMGTGLEVRVPLLDHQLVELAWQIPMSMKIHHGTGKWALRQVLFKYAPAGLFSRPKTGFAIPIGQWLRSPLRDWAEGLLQGPELDRGGILDRRMIRQLWEGHLTGRYNAQAQLWPILMFQAWFQANLGA